jgi:hypothetical protein
VPYSDSPVPPDPHRHQRPPYDPGHRSCSGPSPRGRTRSCSAVVAAAGAVAAAAVSDPRCAAGSGIGHRSLRPSPYNAPF